MLCHASGIAGEKVPRLPMTNSDLARLINSDEIQSVVNAPKTPKLGKTMKKNPLKNLGAMLKLNPYAKTIRRQELANAVRTPSLVTSSSRWYAQDFGVHADFCCTTDMTSCV
jgi:60S ribosomal protein L4 C-terminal domain